MISGTIRLYQTGFRTVSYWVDSSAFTADYSATLGTWSDENTSVTSAFFNTWNTLPYTSATKLSVLCAVYPSSSGTPTRLRSAVIPFMGYIYSSNTAEATFFIYTTQGVQIYRLNNSSGVGISTYTNVISGVTLSTSSSSPSSFNFSIPDYTPSTYQITIEDAGNLQQVEFGDPGLVVSSFPYTATVNGNATWYFTGEQSSYTVTAQNTQNMKQIQVGSTVYSSFPASIPITGNTTLQCSGEDDKTITVNYTNTSVPVITDTQ